MKVRDIHIRYEDHVTNPPTVLAAGLTLHSLNLKARVITDCVSMLRVLFSPNSVLIGSVKTIPCSVCCYVFGYFLVYLRIARAVCCTA